MVLGGFLARAKRFAPYGHVWLAAIMAVTLGLHFWAAISTPNLVFDENYYVVEARGIMAGWGPLHIEQPPLGKLFIVSGMRLFGDNPIGWRFSPIIFGTASIVIFYFICRSLNMPRRAQIFATVLLAFENLTFLQSGIAMLDVFFVTLMLGAFLLYLKGKQLAGGLSLGLSVLAKFTGALGGVVILLHWASESIAQRLRLHDGSRAAGQTHIDNGEGVARGFTRYRRSGDGPSDWLGIPFLRRRLVPLVVLGVTAIVCVLVLYPVLHYTISHSFSNPITLLRSALARTTSLTFASGFNASAVRPLSWIVDLEPSFYSDSPQYIAMVTPTIWVMIIPAVLYMLYKAATGSEASLFGLAWFAGTYLIWIPVVLVTDRMTYLYYIYPAIGSICVGIGLGMNDLLEMGKAHKRKLWRRLAPAATYGYLALDLAFFIVLSPVFWPLARWFPIAK